MLYHQWLCMEERARPQCHAWRSMRACSAMRTHAGSYPERSHTLAGRNAFTHPAVTPERCGASPVHLPPPGLAMPFPPCVFLRHTPSLIRATSPLAPPPLPRRPLCHHPQLVPELQRCRRQQRQRPPRRADPQHHRERWQWRRSATACKRQSRRSTRGSKMCRWAWGGIWGEIWGEIWEGDLGKAAFCPLKLARQSLTQLRGVSWG